jgi:putative transposase
MKITIKCRLNPDNKQIKILDKTSSKCLEALNHISDIAFKNKCYNRVALHHLTYYKVKSKFKFSSQVCCAIKDKVAFSYKTNKKKLHIFKQSILPLNFTRTVSLKGLEMASISTLKGRQKIAIILGDYQKQMLTKAIKFCDSELIKRNNKFYLNITIEIPDEPLKETKNVIGVDVGIKNLATCSTGDNFTGEQVQSVRNRYQTLRSQLQSKGTRSAKRHLKKMSGREKRFQKDINHCISKRIIELAKQHNSALALEDLKNIRKTARQRKKQRGIFNRWAFNQLRNFISYKAQRQGIPMMLVEPAYTSKTCSSCGNLGIRNGQIFHCSSCSFQADADFNASRNIQRVAFNQPIVAGVLTVKGADAQLRPSPVTIS